MNPTDALEADLPPPRDDEPSALRRDIIDELADHLECSFRHEMLRGQDPVTARARAIERFGDPASLARRLWLDAMKGRIMKQRFLIGGGVVVVLASLALSSLAVFASTRTRQADLRRSQSLEAALVASREANQVMIARLDEVTLALKSPPSVEWNPVKVSVVEETLDGPPAKRIRVKMSLSNDISGRERWTVLTDSEGRADLGLHHPGYYELAVERRTTHGMERSFRSLKINPGCGIVKSVVCPRVPDEKSPVKLTCGWPREFDKDGLFLYVPFVLDSRHLPGDEDDNGNPESWRLGPQWFTSWNIGPRNRVVEPLYEKLEFQAYLFGSDGSTIEFREGRSPFLWGYENSPPKGLYVNQSPLVADVLDADRIPYDPGRAKWVCWSYGVGPLMVLKPVGSKDIPSGRRRYEVVTGVLARHGEQAFPNGYQFFTESPAEDALRRPFDQLTYPDSPWMKYRSVPGPTPVSSCEGATFEVRPDHPNEWTIPFPEELTQELRKALKKP